MAGGITEPPEKKRVAYYEDTIQGSTVAELMDQLSTLPPNATVKWVDSFEDEGRSMHDLPMLVAGIGFTWPHV